MLPSDNNKHISLFCLRLPRRCCVYKLQPATPRDDCLFHIDTFRIMNRLSTQMCSRRSELAARSRCLSANLQTLDSVCEHLEMSRDETLCFVAVSHHADCFVGVMPDSAPTTMKIRGRDELCAFLKGVREHLWSSNNVTLQHLLCKYNVPLLGNHIFNTTHRNLWVYHHSDATPFMVDINGQDALEDVIRGPKLLDQGIYTPYCV
jgi:hypothetical protein